MTHITRVSSFRLHRGAVMRGQPKASLRVMLRMAGVFAASRRPFHVPLTFVSP